MWSKDIIFLVSDGYEDGAQAWLDAYHGVGQTSQSRPHNHNLALLSVADLDSSSLSLSQT